MNSTIRSYDRRAYHQLGNAVCPPIVAAIAAALLDALGLLNATPLPSNRAEGIDDDDNRSEDIAEAARSRRRHLAPALGLLLKALPRPCTPRLNIHKEEGETVAALTAAFLRGDPRGPVGYVGFGGSQGMGGAEIAAARRLLSSGHAEAQMRALAGLGQVLFAEARNNGALSSRAGALAEWGGALKSDSSAWRQEGSSSRVHPVASCAQAAINGGLFDIICASCLPTTSTSFDGSEGGGICGGATKDVSRTAPDSASEVARLAVIAVQRFARLSAHARVAAVASTPPLLVLPRGAAESLRAVAEGREVFLTSAPLRQRWVPDERTADAAKTAVADLQLAETLK